MKFEDAIKKCHVRSSIYQTSNPTKKYANNHPDSFESRITRLAQLDNDWEEWDPRDDDHGSLSMFND